VNVLGTENCKTVYDVQPSHFNVLGLTGTC